MEPTLRPFPDVFELIGQSLKFFKKNFKTLILIGVLPVILTIVSQHFSQILENNRVMSGVMVSIIVFSIIFAVLSFVFQIVQSIAYVKGIQQLDQGQTVGIEELYKNSFKLFFPFIWVTILTSLVIMGAGIFLIIPGVIAAVYLSTTNYLTILDSKKGLDSLSTSYFMIKGRWWPVFGRILGVMFFMLIGWLLLIAVLSIILFGLAGVLHGNLSLSTIEGTLSSSGFFTFFYSAVITFLGGCVFTPLVVYPFYSLYKYLKETTPTIISEGEFKKAKNWFMGLSIWGVVASVLFILVAFMVIAFGAYNLINNATLSEKVQVEILDQYIQSGENTI